MPVVSVCPVHGPFRSRAIQATNSTNITISGGGVESCPECGRASQLMQGTFDFDSEGIASVLSAPAWTRFALRQVQTEVRQLANALEDSTLSDTEVERIAEQVTSRIAAKDERVADMIVAGIRGKPRNVAIAFLLSIITVLTMIDGAVGGARLTHDVIERIVHDVFD